MKLSSTLSLMFAAVSCAAAPLARAQDAYPVRAITIIVPTSPGRSTDASARLFADSLSKTLKQPVVVDNKPGVGGVLGMRLVANAKPDGYTLGWYYSDALTLSPLSYRVAPYDSVADFALVGDAVRTGGILIAADPKSIPPGSFEDFKKIAKGNKLTYASWGVGSSAHLGFEIMGEKLGFQMLHVPFKSGNDGELAALAGQVDLVAGTTFVQTLKTGRLRPIAVGGPTRNPDLPNVPTLAELGLGEEIFAPVTYGVTAPKGTPKAILDKIHAGMKEWLSSPETVARLKALNLEPALSGPEEVVKYISRTRELYLPVVRRLNLINQ